MIAVSWLSTISLLCFVPQCPVYNPFIILNQSTGMDDLQVLERFGLKVPKEQVPYVMELMREDPVFQSYIQKMKSSSATMLSEDKFLETINSLHQSISEIPENSKVICRRDNTYTIRAINPENIKSLTERAFFNSFNLERNVLNDLEEENKINRGPYWKDSKLRAQHQINNQRSMEGEDSEKCICGKNIPGSEWVLCSNEEKCRGSSWYHIKCAGFDPSEVETLKDKEFICDNCKRDDDAEEESPASESRKRVKQDESV